MIRGIFWIPAYAGMTSAKLVMPSSPPLEWRRGTRRLNVIVDKRFDDRIQTLIRWAAKRQGA